MTDLFDYNWLMEAIHDLSDDIDDEVVLTLEEANERLLEILKGDYWKPDRSLFANAEVPAPGHPEQEEVATSEEEA